MHAVHVHIEINYLGLYHSLVVIKTQAYERYGNFYFSSVWTDNNLESGEKNGYIQDRNEQLHFFYSFHYSASYERGSVFFLSYS